MATDSVVQDPLVQRLLGELEAGSLEIPPLPEVAQRVLSLTRDESTSGFDLAELVHRDASLATAVLRASNSAALGAGTRIVSLRQALARLGMERIAEITVAVCLRRTAFQASAYAELLEALWRRSLATALFAKLVARKRSTNVEVVFLCGLLRRVGQPLALHALSSTLPAPERPPLYRARALAQDLEPHFAAAAACAWELPDEVAASLCRDGQQDEHALAQATAEIAERLADLALADAEEESDVRGGEAARILDLYPDDLRMLLAHAPDVRSEVEGAA